ncbi:MAG: antitoxin family protein [Chloroflexi bacterium]|nr:antitoxin family protein [Chloroflexota bacterium]
MTVTTIQATYIRGVLKPVVPVNLPEGATVEIRIVSPASPAVNRFGSLAGKLSYLSDQVVADIERELFDLRRQSSDRLAHLLKG